MNERADIARRRISQTLPGGERILIRAVRPPDAGALQAYFRELSGESRCRRFLGALAELTAKQLARLTDMGGPDELALLAFARAPGTSWDDTSCLVGEAVLARVPGGARVEFALSVDRCLAAQRRRRGAARGPRMPGADARRPLSLRRRPAHQHAHEEPRPQDGLCVAKPVHGRAPDRDRQGPLGDRARSAVPRAVRAIDAAGRL